MKGFFRAIAITITVALLAACGGSSESSQSSGIYAEKIPAILALVANVMRRKNSTPSCLESLSRVKSYSP